MYNSVGLNNDCLQNYHFAHSPKQLDKLSDNLAQRLVNSIYKLSIDPHPPGHKKLKGRDGYRIRVGDYRIIYEVFDEVLLITVVAIGHRKDIYN